MCLGRLSSLTPRWMTALDTGLPRQRWNLKWYYHCHRFCGFFLLFLRAECTRLNHNKGSKSVPLFVKNQLSYTPFILLPQVYIAFHSTFLKISDTQLLSFIFYTTLKLLPTWLSQTLQICERSYFMLKIVAKTPRISLYSSYLHI